MHVEAHLACGWLLANLAPGSSRRERLLIVLAAVISDADGLSYLAGAAAYSNWHHTAGHTLLSGVLVAAAAALLTRGRRWPTIGLLSLIAFASHLAGDYFLSAWPLPLLAPFSDQAFAHRPAIPLDHPINIALSYAGLALMAGSLWIWRRTPLEFLWPRLDALLARMAAPRRLHCSQCGRRTAVTCDTCGRPVCLRHARLRPNATVQCPTCAGQTIPASEGKGSG